LGVGLFSEAIRKFWRKENSLASSSNRNTSLRSFSPYSSTTLQILIQHIKFPCRISGLATTTAAGTVPLMRLMETFLSCVLSTDLHRILYLLQESA
jgi:hypothetical protein